MGRDKKIVAVVSITVFLLATGSCTVRKPAGGYLFLPPESRASYTETLPQVFDGIERVIQEPVAVDTVAPALHEPQDVSDTALPEAKTEISKVIPEAEVSGSPAGTGRYAADNDITLLKESNVTDPILVHDLSSYLAAEKNLSLVDSLSDFLTSIRNEFRVIDYRMVSLENLILSRSTADTSQVDKEIIPEKQIYQPVPEPEFKTRREAVAGQTVREMVSPVPDKIERDVIIMTDTVYIRIGSSKPDTIVKDDITDSLLLELTHNLGAVADSIESLRRSLDPGLDKTHFRVDTVFLYNDTLASEYTILERKMASLRDAYESQLRIKDDSLQNLRRVLSETRAMLNSSDTVTFKAYYESNSFVPNNADSLRSVLSQIPASSVREINISAFTDASGSALYNKTLSGKRIDYITSLLIDTGIEPGKVLSQNFGELFAAEDKSDPIRRVEVRIITEINHQ